MTKKKLFIDMDGVLADGNSAASKLPKEVYDEFAGRHDEIPGFFLIFDPIKDSVGAVETLSKYFDLFILSTPSWGNAGSFGDKIDWIKNLYGDQPGSPFYKKVVLTHRKDLLLGDYLIDDRPVNGAKDFPGEFIHFGSEKFRDWNFVVKYLLDKEGFLIEE